ncbi:MAG: polysaccharide deacetylase family protein [Bacteroidota bacterium]
MNTIRISIQTQGIRRARFDYLLDFLNGHPYTQWLGQRFVIGEGNADIQYGGSRKPDGDGLYVSADPYSLAGETSVKREWALGQFLHGRRSVYGLVDKTRRGQLLADGCFGFDVFESLFFHISRYEEWQASEAQMDEHGRMKEGEQYLVKHDLCFHPVVDQLLGAFLETILEKPLPKRASVFRMSHDIDELVKFEAWWRIWRSSLGMIWRRQSPAKMIRLWQSYWRSRGDGVRDPYDTYGWMLKQEEDFQKVLYLHVGGQHKFDSPYSLDHPQVQRIRQLCRERAYIIGVHPSYEAAVDASLLAAEKTHLEEWLGKTVTYSRQHYLRFGWPETPDILEAAGIEEDSSLGFAHRIGFRCGTAFPYHLYNFREERPYRFREVPMSLMDVSLFRQSGYDVSQLVEIWHSFLSQHSHQSMLTFNFHNCRFDDAWIHGIDLQGLYQSLQLPTE